MPCAWLEPPLTPWLRRSVPVAIFATLIGLLIREIDVAKVVFTSDTKFENLVVFAILAAVITISATAVAIYAIHEFRNRND